jgi:hypothetical protein
MRVESKFESCSANAPIESPTKGVQSLSHPFFDFWFLGGASIVLWAVMMIGQLFRDRSGAVDQHFFQVSATFGILSLFCNYPHFLVSYRFGYGRGRQFIQNNWFSLIFVPLGLIGIFSLSFLSFGIETRYFQNLGKSILSASVWLMYLTVGWHYAKQVFGCMMVYAHYHHYPILASQRTILKASTLSVAFFEFVYYCNYTVEQSSSTQTLHFYSVPIPAWHLPSFVVWIAGAGVALFSVLSIYKVFYFNLRHHQQLPPINFIIPWIAFYIWWVPLIRQSEFFFLAVPFFHSLQYLPFAYRIELKKVKQNNWFYFNVSARILALFLIGFLAFEGIPFSLDYLMNTDQHQLSWFFAAAFAIFFNIHHFFIDSVAWKFDHPEVRDGVLAH